MLVRVCQSIISTKQTLFCACYNVKYCALLLLEHVRIRKINSLLRLCVLLDKLLLSIIIVGLLIYACALRRKNETL